MCSPNSGAQSARAIAPGPMTAGIAVSVAAKTAILTDQLRRMPGKAMPGVCEGPIGERRKAQAGRIKRDGRTDMVDRVANSDQLVIQRWIALLFRLRCEAGSVGLYDGLDAVTRLHVGDRVDRLHQGEAVGDQTLELQERQQLDGALEFELSDVGAADGQLALEQVERPQGDLGQG